MDTAVLLLILRIASAVVLLAFLAAIGWLLQREIDEVSREVQDDTQSRGSLIVVQPEQPPRAVALRSVLSIGRAAGNAVVLDNSYASARHAMVTWRDNQWWIEDLQSRNGTLINDIPVDKPTVITPDDTIMIGDAVLKIDLNDY